MQRKVLAIYVANAAKPEFLLQSFHISFESFFTNIDFLYFFQSSLLQQV